MIAKYFTWKQIKKNGFLHRCIKFYDFYFLNKQQYIKTTFYIQIYVRNKPINETKIYIGRHA